MGQHRIVNGTINALGIEAAIVLLFLILSNLTTCK